MELLTKLKVIDPFFWGQPSGIVKQLSDRGTSFMFQADALMPWKTVIANVMMGPLFRGQTHNRRVEEAGKVPGARLAAQGRARRV